MTTATDRAAATLESHVRSFRFDRETWAAICALARRRTMQAPQGRTVSASAIVREAVTQYLGRHHRKGDMSEP